MTFYTISWLSFQVNMFIGKVLQAPVGRVRCSVVVRSLPRGPTRSGPGHTWSGSGPAWSGPAVCWPRLPVNLTSSVRTLSGVSSLSASRTSLHPDTVSGSRGLLESGTMLRLRVTSRARSLSGSSAGGGWYDSLAESGPVRLCEQCVMGVQQLTGFPWWLSIIASTVMVRTLITLPLAAYQLVIIAKVSDRGHHSLPLSPRAD